ncbi:MAG: signal peptidase I [Prevotella sp.]|nr:signal peptidase I [Prevotella sp.]
MAYRLKYVVALASAFLLMLIVHTLACSIHSVNGNGLAPLFHDGDCLLVNRCSYGLRIRGNGLLPYSRLLKKPVQRGDIVAFTLPEGYPRGLMIARCSAVPGDTIRTLDGTMTVPGLVNCAKADHYWLESINQQNPIDSRHVGFVPESNIVGRVVTVLYNRKRLQLQ